MGRVLDTGRGDRPLLVFRTDVESQDVTIFEVALAYPGAERHGQVMVEHQPPNGLGLLTPSDVTLS